jgi:hypothetical protein
MNPATHGIILEAKTRRTVIEIFLNGFPVGLCGQGVSRGFSRPVNEYLVDGENELAILVNPGDSPAEALRPSTRPLPAWGAQPPPDPRTEEFVKSTQGDGPDVIPEATVSLMLYRVGAMAGDGSGVPLLTTSWNWKDNPGEPTTPHTHFPRMVTERRNLGPMFGPVRWQSAPALELDEDTETDVQAFVLAIHSLVEEGQAQPILDISRDRYSEVSRAYGLSAAERENIFRRVLAEESPKEYWIFETPEPEDFSLRLCAGSRLIECVATDWLPLVRGVRDPEKGRFLFPMFIGRDTQGEWLILR